MRSNCSTSRRVESARRAPTEALVQSVATRCNEWADRIVKARAALTDGINVWGAQIVEHQVERAAALKALEDVVNNLKARNTVGKLNKIDLTKEQLAKAAGGNTVLEWVEDATGGGRAHQRCRRLLARGG